MPVEVPTAVSNESIPKPRFWNDYCQLSHQTKENRFPKIFERIQELQPNPKRILSFGCSTGEEVFTLAERFPNSEIVGVDIDYYSISTGRRNNKFENRVYFHTDSGGTGLYDIVTCFMVLFALDRSIPRNQWEDVVKTIDSHVATNGLLAIYTSEYDFKDYNKEQRYEVIREWKRTHPKNKNKYFCGYYRKRVICNEQ